MPTICDFSGQIEYQGSSVPFSVFSTDERGIGLIEDGLSHKANLKPIFIPHAKQVQFFSSRKRFVGFGGARGGGKTAADVWKAVFDAQTVEGCNILVLRRTIPELKRTLLDGPSGFRTVVPRDLYEHWNSTDRVATLENGSKIWFGGADNEDDWRKYLSGEFKTITFDEQSEFPYHVWKPIGGSCRCTIPFDIFGNKVVAQIVGTFNPGGVGGDFNKALFVDKKQRPGEDPTTYNPDEYEFIQCLVDENPAYAPGTEAGDQYRQMLASQPRRIRDAWLYGLWEGFEGQYFDILDESVTQISHDEFLRLIAKQHWAPRWIGIDWGMSHHAYACWNALLEIDGRQFVVTYASYLTKGLGEAALAQEICDLTGIDKPKISKIYLSPETFGETSFSRARRMGDVFVSNGLPRPIPAYNKREDGWRLMYELLNKRFENVVMHREARTLAGWLITDHRVNPVPAEGDLPTPLECLAQAECDPKHDGDVKKDGDAVYLDVNDGLRYAIASHIRPNQQPFDEKVKEALSKIPVEGPGRYIKHLQLKQKEKTSNSGVFYVGRTPRKRR